MYTCIFEGVVFGHVGIDTDCSGVGSIMNPRSSTDSLSGLSIEMDQAVLCMPLQKFFSLTFFGSRGQLAKVAPNARGESKSHQFDD